MNRRLLIPVVAGVVVVALWFVALWGPQGSALSAAKKRAADAVAKRETLRDQLTRLQQSRRDQPLKQAQLETLRVAIPDDPNLAQFILDANDAASRSGIDFLSITPTPPSATTSAGSTATTTPGVTGGPGGPPPAIRLAMSISGGYFQVLDFVNRVDRLPRIVVVDALSAAGGATTGGASTGQLQVTLQARMFTTTAKAVAGATGATGATTTTSPGGAGATTTTASH
ncbi:MAG: Tfp pilus assembly protein PilO [Acidimicrobiales bacterium]|nr:Tfp pilus assembly protein PilO [Acidimicrobiales bacterium]